MWARLSEGLAFYAQDTRSWFLPCRLWEAGEWQKRDMLRFSF